ncbi:MAG TPA: NUDIX domain-containing protein, partial [Flavobacteriaceae bacterium]
FDNGLTEHEYDHVMVGYYNEVPNINKDEVADWKWMSLDEVKKDLVMHPEYYTVWFKIIFDKFHQHINIVK